MNAAAAEALYEAERKGVRRVKGSLFGSGNGMCALGVLQVAGFYYDVMETTRNTGTCPLCGVIRDRAIKMDTRTMECEGALVAHLNDTHDMTFSEIARKLGPDHV